MSDEEKTPCPVCKFHWNVIVYPGAEHNPNCPQGKAQGGDSGPALGCPRPAQGRAKVARSQDVMESIRTVLASYRGERASVSDVGIAIYVRLKDVPEFYADNLRPVTSALSGDSVVSTESSLQPKECGLASDGLPVNWPAGGFPAESVSTGTAVSAGSPRPCMACAEGEHSGCIGAVLGEKVGATRCKCSCNHATDSLDYIASDERVARGIVAVAANQHENNGGTFPGRQLATSIAEALSGERERVRSLMVAKAKEIECYECKVATALEHLNLK